MAEQIPDLNSIASAFSNADRNTLRTCKNTQSPAYGTADLHRLRFEWRKARVSPARCISCGSTSIFPLNENSQTDPVSGRTFTYEGSEFYESVFPVQIRLSPEGLMR
jgi:hypothetical protein